MCIRRLRHYETGDEPRFRETGHGFTNIGIRNARARATISTCAGQGLCYRPTRCMDDLLFVGNRAYYGCGKATGGGIPVCRPWVGAGHLDKAAEFARKAQSGPATVEGDVDRIYRAVDGDLLIDDASLARRIRITSRGCSTAVVWNPPVEIAAGMADLDGSDYRRMICAETANAGPETVEILANDDCRLEAEYTIGA
jgi:D-hexose-6-phosphate mutarotase